MTIRKARPFGLWLVAALLFAGVAFGAAVEVDESLYDYQKTEGVSGTIKSVGSDTMNNLMTLWSEHFKELYPNVQIEIEGKGSSTAPPALISGQSNFGPMSREMKDKEQDEFEARYGYKATQVPTSIDMLAVYVNKDNPIQGLNFRQIDAIFSSTRKLGGTEDIRTWGQLGLTGEWADKPISIYGRNSASGTYAFFKEHCLGKGDYKSSVKEQPGSSAVVQAVATDRYAIGYSGIGYKTADVRVVPLAHSGTDYVEADPENAYTGDYPLARFLWLTVNHKPGSQLDPLRREFMKLIFSRQGQEVVVKDGYYPLPARICRQSLEKLGITWPAD